MLYVHHHLGLGDHIVCNGLVLELQKLVSDEIGLFVKHKNFKSVEFLYKSNPKIKLISVKGDSEALRYCNDKDNKCLRVGHENLQTYMRNNDWVESFYNQLNIDYTCRWSSFNIDRNYQAEDDLFKLKNPKNEKYALIHSTSSDGGNGIDYSKINFELKRIEVTNEFIGTNTIFDYIKLILNAEEIHCIDSSFIHLVDSFSISNKLFYHKTIRYRGWTSEYKLKNNWKVI